MKATTVIRKMTSLWESPHLLTTEEMQWLKDLRATLRDRQYSHFTAAERAKLRDLYHEVFG